MRADILPDIDRGESLGLMEPLILESSARGRPALTDLALELAKKSVGLSRSLPPAILNSLANLVRAMNCYYSNLIEGHNTHPIDIERALKHDYSQDLQKRDLQIEATAHIAVQEWIDNSNLRGRESTEEGIREIHRRFCKLLPPDLLWVENPKSGKRLPLIPGELRSQDVAVGRHVPVSAGALPRFLTRFEGVYSRLGQIESIISAAAAHHRILWLHPFMDGNGRVARLMSHATLLEPLETRAIWSIARGLARNSETYKAHLDKCDQTRRNDLDGRGNLSEEALTEFTRFFLATCIDQVTFMEGLVQPERLRARILQWIEEEITLGKLPPKSAHILEATLYRGQLNRSDAANIIGATDRHSRRIVAALIDRGVLTSENPRAPLHLAFPATLASRWMPGLFPDQN